MAEEHTGLHQRKGEQRNTQPKGSGGQNFYGKGMGRKGVSEFEQWPGYDGGGGGQPTGDAWGGYSGDGGNQWALPNPNGPAVPPPWLQQNQQQQQYQQQPQQQQQNGGQQTYGGMQ